MEYNGDIWWCALFQLHAETRVTCGGGKTTNTSELNILGKRGGLGCWSPDLVTISLSMVLQTQDFRHPGIIQQSLDCVLISQSCVVAIRISIFIFSWHCGFSGTPTPTTFPSTSSAGPWRMFPRSHWCVQRAPRFVLSLCNSLLAYICLISGSCVLLAQYL